ncbi:MAG: 4'-phosphopantetheinyl transferase superfamily protein [Phaeodactylibacter sp.]|nr:4'-phosphopantetheinyl transferase superfamily protein [Phaeodactylibacter sp.]MCB9276652.1 4'-phosphopantetheinyl transferase superfamily protein [Lewinellaceae bacterium]
MPIILHEHIQPEGELGIWRIEETEAWFRDGLALSDAEQEQLAQIRGRRRVEWLAARQLVHDMSGRGLRAVFYKDEFGKPHLEGSAYQISISHSGGLAAAIAAPFPVGVDIQNIVPRISHLAHKFMRPDELASLQPATRIEHIHVYWGAKEALYKAYGRRALDFCAHIHVGPFAYSPAGGECEGVIRKDAYEARFRLRYAMVEDFVLVYAIGTGV